MRMLRSLSRLALALGALAALPASAQDNVSLRLNWQILGFHSAFYLGVERGFYRENGINLTINEGRGGAVTAQAIGAKSDQFGIVDGGTTIVSAARGIPIRTVMTLMNGGIFAVVARADANIRTAKDIEGKAIAVTAGDALTQLWPAVVRVNKLDPNKIRLVNVDPAGKVVATLEKRTDALLGSIDAQSFQLEARGVKTNMLTYDELGVNLVGLTVVVHEDFIKSSPDLIRRFVRATRRSFEVARAEPMAAAQAAIKIKPELDATSLRQQLEASLSKFESPNTKGLPIGVASLNDWKSTLDLLTEYQGIKTDRAATTFFTNDFAR
ncbi:MAG: ABC transporter substrate-binding protein [Burkholderiales bacterium]|nr:ABC transporter substrate-binding protein [Burkholderiales bacterium]